MFLNILSKKSSKSLLAMTLILGFSTAGFAQCGCQSNNSYSYPSYSNESRGYPEDYQNVQQYRNNCQYTYPTVNSSQGYYDQGRGYGSERNYNAPQGYYNQYRGYGTETYYNAPQGYSTQVRGYGSERNYNDSSRGYYNDSSLNHGNYSTDVQNDGLYENNANRSYDNNVQNPTDTKRDTIELNQGYNRNSTDVKKNANQSRGLTNSNSTKNSYYNRAYNDANR